MGKKEFSDSVKENEKNDFFESGKTTDFAGREVTRENAEVDHIYPSSKGGSNDAENAQVVSHETNQAKADNTEWSDNGKDFSVEKSEETSNGVIGKIKE